MSIVLLGAPGGTLNISLQEPEVHVKEKKMEVTIKQTNLVHPLNFEIPIAHLNGKPIFADDECKVCLCPKGTGFCHCDEN